MTSQFLKKFLGPTQIEAALVEVSELPDIQHVRIAVAGGIAMQVYGSDRLTKDIDFVADRTFAGIEVLKKLSFGGVGGLTIASRVPVDVIVRDDEGERLYIEALVNAQPSADLLGALIVGPEYLAAMKLFAGRVKDEEDLRFLIRTDAINVEKTAKIIKKCLGAFAEKEFRSHVDEMAWRMEKERREE